MLFICCYHNTLYSKSQTSFFERPLIVQDLKIELRLKICYFWKFLIIFLRRKIQARFTLRLGHVRGPSLSLNIQQATNESSSNQWMLLKHLWMKKWPHMIFLSFLPIIRSMTFPPYLRRKILATQIKLTLKLWPFSVQIKIASYSLKWISMIITCFYDLLEKIELLMVDCSFKGI